MAKSTLRCYWPGNETQTYLEQHARDCPLLNYQLVVTGGYVVNRLVCRFDSKLRSRGACRNLEQAREVAERLATAVGLVLLAAEIEK